MPNPIKSFAGAADQVPLDLLKALAILSDTTAKTSTPKTILEMRKKATFPLVINNLIIYRFFKDFTNHKNFNCRAFSNIIKCKDHS